MPEIKLIIDGTDYDVKLLGPSDFEVKLGTNPTPVIIFDGKYLVGEAVKKDIPKDFEVLQYYYKDRLSYFSKSNWGDGYDWEQIPVKYPSVKISMVKRLSDNEVFSKDEVAGHKDWHTSYQFTITEFYIRHTGIMACKGWSTEGYTPVPVDYSIENWVKVKPKVPLFTTSDGVEIFEGDGYFLLIKYSFEISACKAPKGDMRGKSADFLTFSTFEKAKDWAIKNKPQQCTYNEIINVLSCQDMVTFEVNKSALMNYFKSKILLDSLK